MLVLFESLLDKSKGRSDQKGRRGLSRSASNLYATFDVSERESVHFKWNYARCRFGFTARTWTVQLLRHFHSEGSQPGSDSPLHRNHLTLEDVCLQRAWERRSPEPSGVFAPPLTIWILGILTGGSPGVLGTTGGTLGASPDWALHAVLLHLS